MKPLNFLGTPIHLARDFGSESVDHRIKLRTALQAYVRDKSRDLGVTTNPDAVDSLTDLSKPPRLSGWAISVSHCRIVGGFIAKPSAGFIGVDFEEYERLSTKILERMAAHPREKKLLTNLGEAERPYFWVAKEAAIKAYGNAFPESRPHFSNVEILELRLDRFSFRSTLNTLECRGSLFPATMIDARRMLAAACEIGMSD